MKKRYCFAILLVCLMLIVSSCGDKAAQTNSETLPTLNENIKPTTEETTNDQSAQVKETTKNCPLTGLPMEDTQADIRPIAVMIDNMVSARPQSGLINADIVYEMPAEGGITRYLAIFHHQSCEKIGPVRSARSYFIDKAMEYNAIYIHCGGSPEALKDIKTLKVDSLNELNGETNFWRARDRKAPHNLYTSTKLTWEVMEKRKLNEKWDTGFSFSSDFLELDGKTANNITIDYLHNYKCGYEYDEKEKKYYRLVNGVRLIDKETDLGVSTVNIIVERVNTEIVDDVGRLDISNTGTGRGYYITGGKLIEIKWKKDNRQDKTKYTDLKGNPIQLNKGNTWIQVIPEYAIIEVKE